MSGYNAFADPLPIRERLSNREGQSAADSFTVYENCRDR